MKVAIVGGGIGGLATAIALHSHGIEAHVYEQASQWQPLGVGILIPCNAMQVLQRLGIANAVEQAGNRIDSMEIWVEEGSLLQATDLSGFADRFARRAPERPEPRCRKKAVPAQVCSFHMLCTSFGRA